MARKTLTACHTDREREHKRTHRHPTCVAMMTAANFDAVPSLAEAMGLTEEAAMTTTYPDIYPDPMPGREFAFRVGGHVWYAGESTCGMGVIQERGRRMMYAHVYLVGFDDGSTRWIEERNLVPD